MSKTNRTYGQSQYACYCCKCGQYHFVNYNPTDIICYVPCEYGIYQCVTETCPYSQSNQKKRNRCTCCPEKSAGSPVLTQTKVTCCDCDRRSKTATVCYSTTTFSERFKDFEKCSDTSSDCCGETSPRYKQLTASPKTDSCPVTKWSSAKKTRFCTPRDYVPKQQKSSVNQDCSEKCCSLKASDCKSNLQPSCPEICCKCPRQTRLCEDTESVCNSCFQELQMVDEQIMVAPSMSSKEVMAMKLERCPKGMKCAPKCVQAEGKCVPAPGCCTIKPVKTKSAKSLKVSKNKSLQTVDKGKKK